MLNPRTSYTTHYVSLNDEPLERVYHPIRGDPGCTPVPSRSNFPAQPPSDDTTKQDQSPPSTISALTQPIFRSDSPQSPAQEDPIRSSPAQRVLPPVTFKQMRNIKIGGVKFQVFQNTLPIVRKNPIP